MPLPRTHARTHHLREARIGHDDAADHIRKLLRGAHGADASATAATAAHNDVDVPADEHRAVSCDGHSARGCLAQPTACPIAQDGHRPIQQRAALAYYEVHHRAAHARRNDADADALEEARVRHESATGDDAQPRGALVKQRSDALRAACVAHAQDARRQLARADLQMVDAAFGIDGQIRVQGRRRGRRSVRRGVEGRASAQVSDCSADASEREKRGGHGRGVCV